MSNNTKSMMGKSFMQSTAPRNFSGDGINPIVKSMMSLIKEDEIMDDKKKGFKNEKTKSQWLVDINRQVEQEKLDLIKEPDANSFLIKTLVKGMIIKENKGLCGKGYATEELVGQVDKEGSMIFTNVKTTETFNISANEFAEQYRSIKDIPNQNRVSQKVSGLQPYPKNEENLYSDITKQLFAKRKDKCIGYTDPKAFVYYSDDGRSQIAKSVITASLLAQPTGNKKKTTKEVIENSAKVAKVRFGEYFYENMIDYLTKRRQAVQKMHQKMRRALFTKKLDEIRENLKNMPNETECDKPHEEESVHDHNLDLDDDEPYESEHQHKEKADHAIEEELQALPESNPTDVYLSLKNIFLLQNKDKGELNAQLKLNWEVKTNSNRAQTGTQSFPVNKEMMGPEANRFPIQILTSVVPPIRVQKGQSLYLSLSETESNSKNIEPLRDTISHQQIVDAQGSYELLIGIDISSMRILNSSDKKSKTTLKRKYLVQFVEDLSKDHT